MELIVGNVRLIDTRHPQDERTTDITIGGGRIRSIETNNDRSAVRRIDGGRRFALPGLVNAHDHLYSQELRNPIAELGLAGMRTWIDRREPAETLVVMLRNALWRLREGLVVERDLGANHGLNVELARLIDQGTIPGPTVVPAGRPIVMTGGHVFHIGREANGPWQCREAVREQAKAHAKVIKVMCSGGLSRFPDEDFGLPEFSLEEIEAIVDESHRRGLPTCAHAFHKDAVTRALDGGIDSIEHGVWIGSKDIERMARNGTSYVPTVSNMRRVAEIAHSQAEAEGRSQDQHAAIESGVLEPHVETVRLAVEAGVRIGLGTDSTGTYRDEVVAMMEAGMDSLRVIQAATIDGAEICRVNAGSIEPGFLGSVLLYDTDPREDPTSLTSPSLIVHRGATLGPDFWSGWGLEVDRMDSSTFGGMGTPSS